jgi:hypothetical protein
VQPVAPAASYDVHVVVREAADGSLGVLTLTAVTFWLDDGCDGGAVVAGTFPVIDPEGDGVGDVIANITGLDVTGCVTAELVATDGSESRHYTADPIVATVSEQTDGFVTGGGRFDTAEGWLSVGFVARQRDGVLSGHVEIVQHGQGVLQSRSVELTSMSIVDEPDGGVTATVSATFLQHTAAGWVETELTLVAHDGGKGRRADWVSCTNCPPAIDGTFRGQVTVHTKRK